MEAVFPGVEKSLYLLKQQQQQQQQQHRSHTLRSLEEDTG